MKDFNWTQFTQRIAVNATISELYNAWTQPQGLEKWFLEEAVFTDAKGKQVGKTENVQKGDAYAWRWFAYAETESGKITAANGKDAFQFTFAGTCLVDIHLHQHKDFVIVELTQKNIPTDDLSKQNIRIGCHTGWAFFLVNLKSVYEGGLDLRNKDPEMVGMLNN